MSTQQDDKNSHKKEVDRVEQRIAELERKVDKLDENNTGIIAVMLVMVIGMLGFLIGMHTSCTK